MDYVDTEFLKKQRKLKGYSIRDMSKMLGAKSSATYYNIENNISELKVSQLVKLSEILKVPIKKILL